MAYSKNPKAFTLISDDNIFWVIKKELEKCGFAVEGLLSAIARCSFILLDHESLDLDIVNYLREGRIRKPVLLILKEDQMYSDSVQGVKFFHDILVVPEREKFESNTLISSREGKGSLRNIFEGYYHEVHSPAARNEKRISSYARLSGAV